MSQVSNHFPEIVDELNHPDHGLQRARKIMDDLAKDLDFLALAASNMMQMFHDDGSRRVLFGAAAAMKRAAAKTRLARAKL